MFTELPPLGTDVRFTSAPLLPPEDVLGPPLAKLTFFKFSPEKSLFARLRNLGFFPARAPLVPPLGYPPCNGRAVAGDRGDPNHLTLQGGVFYHHSA